PRIYEDLFKLNHEEPELFETQGQLYEFHFLPSYHTGTYFNVWLQRDIILHDGLEFDFIYAKTGESRFWVYERTHSFMKGNHSIIASLRSRPHDPYREFIIAQADFHNLISLSDIFSLADFQLDNKLREIFGKFPHH
ncbi:hypothetical protein HXX01_03885, partial [Candidatus Nomurabacteria bacterium]|nr:hypothetical protein [Candidatus Nomurabacteria bacterium]